MIKKIIKVLGVIIVLVLVICIAAFAWLIQQGRTPTGETAEYVALGSSFASGSGNPGREPKSPVFCSRSTNNYANILARKRHLKLVDRSCAGATAAQVVRGGQYFQPPQIDALTQDTKLVTVTAGGNDISYIRTLMAWSCPPNPSKASLLLRLMTCREAPSSETINEQLRQLPQAMHDIATTVRARAPNAKLVFVDYTTILPEHGACPERLPLSAKQISYVRNMAAELQEITASAARDTNAILIQVSKLSEGHDLCSTDPWVFPLGMGIAPYHPNEKAMAAIANAIDQALDNQTVNQGVNKS